MLACISKSPHVNVAVAARFTRAVLLHARGHGRLNFSRGSLEASNCRLSWQHLSILCLAAPKRLHGRRPAREDNQEKLRGGWSARHMGYSPLSRVGLKQCVTCARLKDDAGVSAQAIKRTTLVGGAAAPTTCEDGVNGTRSKSAQTLFYVAEEPPCCRWWPGGRVKGATRVMHLSLALLVFQRFCG
jgi:hypothetical protein